MPAPLRLTTALLALALDFPVSAQIFSTGEQEAGLEFSHFNGMTGELYLPEITGAGVALLDYDGDGDLDVYLVQGNLLGPQKTLSEAILAPPGPLPLSDRLFRNDLETGADGATRTRFVDVTQRAGIAATGYGMGAATGDVDGDGWPDLYLTNLGHNQLWHNRGDGTFQDTTAEAGVDDLRWSVAATFFDYDGDSDVDLYVGNYVNFSFVRHRKCSTVSGAPDYCGPLAYSGEPDRLFENRGDGTFVDVSATSGIGRPPASSLGAVVDDYDGDGDLDLYVANDQMPNFLWMNQGDGTFVDDGLLAGCAVNREGQAEASMGVDTGDIDRDGDPDLFMAHLRGETNTLFLNDGHGLFEDVTTQADLASASFDFTAFGAGFLDFDNDGWLDLLTANGAVKTIESQARDREVLPLRQSNQLFRNLGNGRFVDVTANAGEPFAVAEVSRGAAFGDLDNDGDTDVVVTNTAGRARLLVNELGARSSWLGIVPLLGPDGPPALSTLIAVEKAPGVLVQRRVRTDGSYASSHDHRALLGLGEDGAAVVEILWPSGAISRWRAPPVRRWARWLAPQGSGP